MLVMKLPSFPACRPPRLPVGGRTLLVLPFALVLAACATPQAVPVHRPAPVAVNQPLYFYPMRGQDERTQQRDRYECYRWASDQTRSDPGMTPLRHVGAPPPAVYYDPQPGRDTALGAATGAIIGGMTASSPRHAGDAAAVGLVLGAIIGAASDHARAENARQANAQAAAAQTSSTRVHGDFRRAMAACMSGRGYAVR
ncbi:glycine zipper family protein [Caldimonas caldifontis]|uniref:Glycine zipper family protein n=2 Tax=Caldimonas caldifontis TaxID=1452508 RepID=A0A2S5SQW3_9BURK|nr:glycine zipper family protein [Caldimonas caldifontis]